MDHKKCNFINWMILNLVIQLKVLLLSLIKIGNFNHTNCIKPFFLIFSTILIEPKCSAEITEDGDVEINVESLGAESLGDSVNSVHLSIFSHRFMSIAEQMGSVLQRSSISTNIKERLDFSCALFGPDGGLVANAPHIPVHLGKRNLF